AKPVDGARRVRNSAASGFLARDHDSEMGAGIRLRGGARSIEARHARIRHGRQLSERARAGLARIHLFRCGVHAEDRSDRGAAHESRLRSARVRRGCRGPPAPRHAGNGALRRRARIERASAVAMPLPDAGESAAHERDLVLIGRDLVKRFARGKTDSVHALDGVTVRATRGALTALVGPDGAGKTTLLRLAAGLMRADSGTMTVLGYDAAVDAQAIQDRISYMPQRFGLYEDLSVQENLDLYADLHGVSAEQCAERYPRLMEMTD